MKPYIKRLFRKRDEILTKIINYQDFTCKHFNVKRTPKSNTGNWDRTDDRYWLECKCEDCDKFWTEDQ